MHFLSTTIATLLALTGLAASAPAPGDRTTTVPPPALFYLQTAVVPGLDDCGTDKNGLYLYSFHTGAGLGDACLGSNQSFAMQAYLNGTQQLFTYPNNPGPGWPLGISFLPYSLFNWVTISIASTVVTEGFFYNETGLQYNGSIGGWVACDWLHGVPQILDRTTAQAAGPNTGVVPKTCSKVNLMPVAVGES